MSVVRRHRVLIAYAAVVLAVQLVLLVLHQLHVLEGGW